LKQKGKRGSLAKRIIEVFLSSEIMVDIVLLFRNNPRLIASEDHIASKLGKSAESIKDDLKQLVRLGILKIEKSGRQSWFGLDVEKDMQIQELIEAYIRDH
jgi:hypothetical protein